MTSIENLGTKYNNLQIKMGSTHKQDWSDTIPELFSSDFTKTANGTVLVGNRSDLESQIIQCRAAAGTWTIDPTEIIPSKDNHHCTIRYIISTQKAGCFDVMALLKSSNGHQIDSIDEIFYQMESGE